jgi:hypothetical protein
VWLGQTDPTSGAIRQAVGRPTEAGEEPIGNQLLIQFLSGDEESQDAQWTVGIGQAVVQPGPLAQGGRTVDFTDAAKAAFHTASGGQVTADLQFRSALPGLLTITAPKIVFD